MQLWFLSWCIISPLNAEDNIKHVSATNVILTLRFIPGVFGRKTSKSEKIRSHLWARCSCLLCFITLDIYIDFHQISQKCHICPNHNISLDQGHLACQTQLPLTGPVAAVFAVTVFIIVVLFVVVLIVVVLVVVVLVVIFLVVIFFSCQFPCCYFCEESGRIRRKIIK